MRSVVVARKLGAADETLLRYCVTPLTPADVQAAWAYYEQHQEEIEADILENERA